MTVCIAAKAKGGRIFTVSDLRLASDILVVDGGTPKLRDLTDDGKWRCLFSFLDASRLEPLLSRLTKALHTRDLPLTVMDVEECLTIAYGGEIMRMAETKVLRPHMSYDEFRKHGRARLPESVFQQWTAEIKLLNTGVELLVVGFDEKNVPHIRRTDGIGEIFDDDGYGFGAVGVGAQIANGILLSNKDFLETTDNGLIVYRLCEAKFAAESSPWVGGETLSLSFDKTGNQDFLIGDMFTIARRYLEERRKEPVPEEVLSLMRHGVSFERKGSPLEQLASIHWNCYSLEAADAFIEGFDSVVGLILLLVKYQREKGPGKITEDELQPAIAATQARLERLHVAVEEWRASGIKPENFDTLTQRAIATSVNWVPILLHLTGD